MQEEEEFILSVVVKYAGAGRVLSHVPKDIIELGTSHVYFDRLPTDVLVFLLSFVDRKSLKFIASVCQRWNEAFHAPAFWKRHIEAAKQRVLRQWAGTAATMAMFAHFNTFRSPVKETIRQQVEWVFHDATWWYVTAYHGSCRIGLSRRTCNGTWLENFFDGGELRHVTWYVSSTGRREGRSVRVAVADMERIKRLELNAPEALTGTGVISENGTTWEGQCSFAAKTLGSYGRKTTAHGDGKWTFEDGSVLEGEGVAYKGKPRYLEPQSKRVKTRE